MTALNKQALREAAEKATAGQWVVELCDEVYAVDGDDSEQIAMVFSDNRRSDAAFIAAANPATVLALLDELEHYKSRENRVTKLVLDNSKSWGDLYKKLEAAEKRIAELEAKLANPVLLPKTNGYWTEQEKAYEDAITFAKRQVRLAGFRCEGDE